jgi:hypothetical protein
MAVAIDGEFLRIGGQVIASAGEFAHAFGTLPDPVDVPNAAEDTSEPVAHADASGSADDGPATSISHAESTALLPTPIGAETFAPQVNATLFHSQIVSGGGDPGVANALNTWEQNRANATAEFELDCFDAQNCDFHGFLYLVGFENSIVSMDPIFGPTAVADIDERTFVGASITIGLVTYEANASYQPETDDWLLTANLPGGVNVNEVVDSVNRHFDFVVSVGDGANVVFTSGSRLGTESSAVGDDTFAELQATTSALAWGIARPQGIGPIPGDFDGDGDVDNDDFAIWFVNMGIEIGAGGPQGDADLDGDVDSEDIAIWLESTETPGIPGDYNGDNSVDAADYTVWRDTLNSEIDLRADGDLNGIVNTLDYDVWKTYFGVFLMGSGAAGVGQVVPEPNALTLLVVGLIGATLLRRTSK